MNHGDEIDAFLGRYAATLTGFNAKGAADLWAMPGTRVRVGPRPGRHPLAG
jgi:hypothetical protein